MACGAKFVVHHQRYNDYNLYMEATVTEDPVQRMLYVFIVVIVSTCSALRGRLRILLQECTVLKRLSLQLKHTEVI